MRGYATGQNETRPKWGIVALGPLAATYRPWVEGGAETTYRPPVKVASRKGVLMSDYQGYVTDEAWLQEYNRFQTRYKTAPRKSDLDLSALVKSITGDKPKRLLDLGCSTGNLLRTIRSGADGKPISYVGADLAEPSVKEAAADSDLKDMRFHVWDATDIPAGEKFDIVVMSAVAFMLDETAFAKMLGSVCRSLNPGGTFIAWEPCCTLPDYRARVEEHSPYYNGRPHWITIRSHNIVERQAKDAGFASVRLVPFTPPDMPRPPESAYLTSYTTNIPGDGPRSTRGYVILPWAFIVATK